MHRHSFNVENSSNIEFKKSQITAAATRHYSQPRRESQPYTAVVEKELESGLQPFSCRFIFFAF